MKRNTHTRAHRHTHFHCSQTDLRSGNTTESLGLMTRKILGDYGLRNWCKFLKLSKHEKHELSTEIADWTETLCVLLRTVAVDKCCRDSNVFSQTKKNTLFLLRKKCRQTDQGSTINFRSFCKNKATTGKTRTGWENVHVSARTQTFFFVKITTVSFLPEFHIDQIIFVEFTHVRVSYLIAFSQ